VGEVVPAAAVGEDAADDGGVDQGPGPMSLT